MEDNLKGLWHKPSFFSLNEQQQVDIISGRHRTALTRLAERYKWFSNIAIPIMLIVPFTIFHNVLKHTPMNLKLIWVIFAMVYFGLCSVMDRWLYNGIKSIDCATMTVNEVSNKALFYRKRHLQFIVVLLPMAIIVIGSLMMLTDITPYFIYGVIAGGILGLVLGLRQFLNFMADYKSLLCK